MKKILMSLAILVGACSLIFATTRAVWTHNVSVTNNKIVTGSTDLRIATDYSQYPNVGTWDTVGQTTDVIFETLTPGSNSRMRYVFSLWNNSLNPLDLTLGGKILNVKFEGDNIPGDKSKLLLRVYNVDDEERIQISDWKTLNEWENGNIPFNSTVEAGAVKRYGIEVKLDQDAENDWQNQNVSFDMEITGTQI